MVGATVASDGKIVSIVTIFLLITSTLAIITRLWTKWAVSGKANIDDGLAIMALVSQSPPIRVFFLTKFIVMPYWLWYCRVCARRKRARFVCWGTCRRAENALREGILHYKCLERDCQELIVS